MLRSARPSLADAFHTPHDKRSYVRRLFSVIAPRYDLITVVLSYGQDRRWKRRLVSMMPSGAPRVLDLACGTGDIAFEAAARGRTVTALDITTPMLAIARAKPRARLHDVAFVAGDMMALPFPDASFEVVTTGYGLRNVPVLQDCLHEIARVLVPGGVLLSLDFDRPPGSIQRGIYLAYLTVVGSALGLLLHGDPDTYRYIPESIRRYPGAAGVCAIAARAGFSSCRHEPVLGGFMAIHAAVK
jgi:demethylmenaquinone methyltransferase/2-methoxy-6-polyprenyl-1,4-benzoquinol methylase